MSSLWDDLKLSSAAFVDALNPANWVTGSAPLTALAVEAERADKEGRSIDVKAALANSKGGLAKIGKAAGQTAEQVADKAKSAASWAPWVLGGVAVVALIGAAVVYGAPVVAAAKAVKS